MAISQNFPDVRPSLNLNFARSKTLDPRITFERASIGTYVDENGLIKTAAADEARFDHDPTTGESLGLLIEESRTNLVEYGDFTTGWNEYGGTATSTTETAAPDGTFTAKKITSKGDVSTSGIYDSITYSSNTTYTHTMWLKAGTVTIAGITVNSGGKWDNGDYPYITVNLSTGAVTASGGVSAKATAYPNGWYRLEATGTFGGNTQVDAIWVHSQTGSSMSGNTTDYYYVWGPQAEQGNFGTSYIPTSGSTVTRSQDTAKITGTNFTDFYNQPEGTIFADYKVIQSDPEIMYLSDNTSSKRIGLYEAGSNQTRFLIGNSGTQADTTDSTGTTVGDNIKSAGAYKLNDIVAAKNGVISSTDSSATIPDGIDRAYIGGYFNGTAEGVLGLRRLSYYNKRLSNAQLQGLTK